MKKIFIILILILSLSGCLQAKEIIPEVSVDNFVIGKTDLSFKLQVDEGTYKIESVRIEIKSGKFEKNLSIYYSKEVLAEPIHIDGLHKNLNYDLNIYLIGQSKNNSSPKAIHAYSDQFLTNDYDEVGLKIENFLFDKGKVTFDLIVEDIDHVLNGLYLSLSCGNINRSLEIDEIKTINHIVFEATPFLRAQNEYCKLIIFEKKNYVHTQLMEYEFFVDTWIELPTGSVTDFQIQDPYISFFLELNDPLRMLSYLHYTLYENGNIKKYTYYSLSPYANYYEDPYDINFYINYGTLNPEKIEYLKIIGLYYSNSQQKELLIGGKGLTGSSVVIDDYIYFQNIYRNNYLYRLDINTLELVEMTSFPVSNVFYQNNYLYYVKNHEIIPSSRLYRINLNTLDEPESITTQSKGINYIVYKDNTYCISEVYGPDNTIVNGIVKIDQDGKRTIVYFSTNELANLRIAENKIFILVDNNLYSLNIDGTNQTLLTNNKVDSFEIDKGIIYYRHIGESRNYFSKVNHDGTNDSIICEMDPKSITFVNDKIYFYNNDSDNYGIYVYNVSEETTPTLIYQTVANSLLIHHEKIYFFKSSSYDLIKGDCRFYCINLDGTNETILDKQYEE